jgi:hypothetical protein
VWQYCSYNPTPLNIVPLALFTWCWTSVTYNLSPIVCFFQTVLLTRNYLWVQNHDAGLFDSSWVAAYSANELKKKEDSKKEQQQHHNLPRLVYWCPTF